MSHRTLLAAIAWSLSSVAAMAETYSVPLFPSASNALQQGFVRIINRSDASGAVTVHAVDDTGQRLGPVEFVLGANATMHFNSDDLETGNPDKGLAPGIGGGQGDWRLEIATDLDIEPLAYVRTRDGFLTSMHDVAGEDDGHYRVPIFNPASNRNQVSSLRLANPGEDDAVVTVTALDDAGVAPVGGEVGLTIPAGEARLVSSQELESGAAGLEGSFGDGAGKWQLRVSAAGATLDVMSLLESPTGHLTNLSTAPAARLVRTDGSSTTHTVPLFASTANADRQGFVRIINHSGESGTVEVDATDDAGQRFDPLTIALGAYESLHINSDDLETGNADKGLSTGVGRGEGDWRLEFESELDIEVLAYVRTVDGFLTAMHDIVPEVDGIHRAAIFNPASNVNQKSLLRLVNPGTDDAEVAIRGIDDAGNAAPGGDLCVAVPGGAAVTVSAQQMESGDDAFAGRLGDGAGKWQLYLSSTAPVVAMSLLASPTGHLTNLSSAVDEQPDVAPAEGLDCESVVDDGPLAIADANLRDALARELGKEPGAPILARDLATLRFLELRNEAVRDLDGLQHATNLAKLDLGGNPVSDLSVLARIGTLRELDASRTEMSDLASLAGLTQLTKLDLHGNYIEDLTPLSDLTRLVELDLSSNEIADLAPLSGLTALTSLNLAGNRRDHGRRGTRLADALPDLTPLAGLTHLEKLDLSNNEIKTTLGNRIAVLSRLTGLVELDLSRNAITTVVPLSGLTRLTTLDLSHNGYFDLTPLSGLHALTSLKLNHCNVHDLSALSSLTRLEVLELDVNLDIKDLRPLSGLKALASLKLRNNAIIDVSPLVGLTGLRALDLSTNSIYCAAPDDLSECLVDVSPLSRLVGLTDLDLSDTEVADLAPLSRLTELVTLRLHSIRNVSDLSPLSGLAALRHLDLSENRIDGGDLSPLSSLTGLTTLILSYVSVEYHEDRGHVGLQDISALASLTSLARLDLSQNHIQDLAPLASLRRLTGLDLSNNSVEDLAPLSELSALKTLNLAWNNLHGPKTIRSMSGGQWPPHRVPSAEADLSPLEGLANLETLDLSGNCIEDASPLAANTALGRHSTIVVRGNTRGSRRTAEGYRWRSPVCGLDSAESQLAPIRERQGRRAPFAEVAFLDPILRSIVEDHLGKIPGEPILRHEMASIKSMDLRAERIHHLDGLRFAVNLEELDLRRTHLGRFGTWAENLPNLVGRETLAEWRGVAEPVHLDMPLGDLAGLTALKVLHLSDAYVTGPDTVALSGLRGLEELDLGRNEIGFVDNLSELSALKVLKLDGNVIWSSSPDPLYITDLSPLSGLGELRVLDIGNSHCLGPDDNCLRDLSPLSSLTNLTVLNLNGHRITDLAPLAGLAALTALHLSNNTIYGGARLVDLSPLASLAALKSLDLSRNYDVANLAPLADLRNLESLDLENCGELADVSPLAGLGGLTALNIRGTMVTDLSPLAGLSRLEALAYSPRFAGAHVPDLETLSRLPALRELELHVPHQADVSPISGLSNLERLELNTAATGRLSNLASLRTLICHCGGNVQFADMPRLSVLELTGNRSDLSSLARLTNLESLTLPHVLEADLTPLSSLRKLKTLRLTATVSSESAAEGLSSLQALETLALDLYRGGASVDYGFLADLTNLKALELMAGGAQTRLSLPPLDRLSRLAKIDLAATWLDDLTPFRELPAIENLAFNGPPGAALDLSPLSGLATLRVLRLGAHASTDLSPLSGLPALERLTAGAGDTGFDDISLSDLPSLTWIDQPRARGDVSLSNLPSLNSLHVIGNAISMSNLAALRTLRVDLRRETGQAEPTVSLPSSPGVRWISLSGPVSEISLSGFPVLDVVDLFNIAGPARVSLRDLPILGTLRTERVAISELELADLPRLGRVSLPGVGLTSLSLDNLPALNELDLPDNSLSGGDAVTFANLARLREINLGSNVVDDLSFLAGLPQLRRLWLQSNSITDVDSLASLPELWQLRLDSNDVVDLSPLVANKGLDVRAEPRRGGEPWVNVRANPLSDESIETHIPALEDRGVRVYR